MERDDAVEDIVEMAVPLSAALPVVHVDTVVESDGDEVALGQRETEGERDGLFDALVESDALGLREPDGEVEGEREGREERLSLGDVLGEGDERLVIENTAVIDTLLLAVREDDMEGERERDADVVKDGDCEEEREGRPEAEALEHALEQADDERVRPLTEGRPLPDASEDAVKHRDGRLEALAQGEGERVVIGSVGVAGAVLVLDAKGEAEREVLGVRLLTGEAEDEPICVVVGAAAVGVDSSIGERLAAVVATPV